MSKAEKRAKERYSITRGDDTKETSGIDMQRASDFIDGYHQAEKDLELTWEDLKMIDEISDQVYVECDVDAFDEKEYYQEVLRRFEKLKMK